MPKATPLFNIGLQYYKGSREKAKNYYQARTYFKQAIAAEPLHKDANYFLGWMYEHKQGGKKDLAIATEHYTIAAKQGDKRSEKQLLILSHPTRTSETWEEIGDEHYKQKPPNYTEAKTCYEIALKLNKNNADAIYSLAWLHHHAEGTPKDLSKARELYEQATQLGEERAADAILKLDHPKTKNAEQWCDAGDEYHRKIPPNYICAKACYATALQKNKENARALYSMGWLYEQGEGVTKNLLTAREYYQKSKIKLHIKRIERKIIEQAIKKGEDINLVDEHGQTSLHRAAQIPSCKLYARLLCLGANPKATDKKGKTPASYFNAAQQSKMNLLKNRFSEFLFLYNLSAPEIILRNIFTTDGSPLNREKTLTVLKHLYTLPEIKPLLDLTKLATMGKHISSDQPNPLTDGYDSDEEKAITEDQKFKIIIDPHSSTVEKLISIDPDGLAASDSYGFYIGQEETKDSIYIAGQRDSHLVTGAILHEVCHFLIQQIGFVIDQAKVGSILKEMKEEPTIPSLFQIIFNYEKSDRYEEFITRVAEFIAIESNGRERLEEEMPNVLKYYKTFLAAVEEHIQKCETAAFNKWSPLTFTPPKKEMSLGVPAEHKHEIKRVG